MQLGQIILKYHKQIINNFDYCERKTMVCQPVAFKYFSRTNDAIINTIRQERLEMINIANGDMVVKSGDRGV